MDRNNGTRWAPTTPPGYLIVDLGTDYPLGRCETTFELVMRTYRYRIEYLAQSDAASITAAQNSSAWSIYADRSANTENVSPVVDSNRVTARYLKLTLLSADLPTANAEISTILQTDYADRVSVFEFKAFQDNQTEVKADAAKHSPLPVQRNGIISYTMQRMGTVDVRLMNPYGRIIYRHSETRQRGRHELRIRDFIVPTGVYVIAIRLPDSRTGRLAYLSQ